MSTKVEYLDVPKNRANHHYERAIRLLKEGKGSTLELERCVKELNRARALHENQIHHNIALAETYRRALDCSSAIFALRFALDKDPSDAQTRKGLCDLLVNRAQEMMQQGKHFDKASNYFEDALAMDPARDKIWVLKAVCDVQCRNFDTALLCLNRAINMCPNPAVDLIVMRAKIHWAMGLRDSGNKEMRKAAVMDKDHPEVKAFIQRAFGEAEHMYEESLKTFQEGDVDTAMSLVKKSMFVNRNDVKLHIMLSKCHRAKADLDSAYKCLTEAIDIFKAVDPYGMYANVKIPHEIIHQKNLIINEMALKLAMEGDFQKAILLMNKAIAAERQIQEDDKDINYRYFMNRGDCYRALDEPLFAIADYKMALERCPDDKSIITKLSVTYYNLATDYFNDAKYADCKIQMEGAVQLNDKIPEYFSLKGKAEYYLGQYDETYRDFKRSLELNPNDKDLQIRMMQFEKERGMDEMNSLQRFAEEDPATATGQGMTRASMVSSRKGPPMKVKLQPSSINISSDPLGINDDFCKVASREDLSAPLEVSFCSSLLPTLNPYMAGPMIAAELAKKKKKRVQDVTHTRTALKRGNLWKVVDNIQHQAELQRKPLPRNDPEHRRGKDKPKKKAATSAVALKRISEEISREAAKKPGLIQGIVTTKDDPMLVALRASVKQSRGTALSIKDTSNMQMSSSMPRVRIVSRSREAARDKKAGSKTSAVNEKRSVTQSR